MSRLTALAACLVPVAASSISLAMESQSLDAIHQEAQARRQAASSALLEAFPGARLDETGGRITTVSGTAFGSGATPEAAAEQFRAQYAGLFGVPAEQLAPRSFLENEIHTLQLMPDRVNGGYKFTLVLYRQEVDGIPVFRSDLRLLVRNQPGSPLVLARSSLRNVGALTLNRAVATRQDLARAAAFLDEPTLARFTAPQEMIWAGVEDMEVEPRHALVFYAETGPETAPAGYQAFLYVTDAFTGDILYRESAVHHVDITGNVSGMATELPKAAECNNEILQPMPYAAVNIQGQGTVYADADGNFTIPNAGSSDVTVESRVSGRRFIVTDQQGATPVLSQVVTPPGPANFLHNSANNNEFVRASVNCYVEANRVRDMVVAANPTYPTIGTQVNMGVNPNIGQNCNAFYSPSAQTINFYIAGGGCYNSGFGDVVHHEYGHHVVQMGGSGQGQYGEGTGDCMGVLLSDQPILGFGFQTNCNAGIRTADNTLQYPCNGAIHTCGQLISGCVWDLRNLLVQTEPLNYRTILRDLVVNAVPLHGASSNIAPDITEDYLTLDDDDANLANGTPHCYEINTAFKKHNMGSPSVPSFTWSYPGGRPSIVPPNAMSTIDVNASGGCPTPLPGTGKVSYRIGTSGSFTTVPMAVLGPNQYRATLPAAACLDTIQYYFTVDHASGSTISDPINAPSVVYSTLASSGEVVLVNYNFQANPGWTVSGSVADGAWDPNPGVPVNCSRGDPPSDYDGSGNCWMTDNSAANNCNSDVDDGTTTLTSQVFNLSAMTSPIVSYARWYSNSTGNNPQTKTMVIEISTNGGATWSNLETIGPTTSSPHPQVTGGWYYVSYAVPNSSQFRIRFSASDTGTGTGSIVEAAIDAFSIKEYQCPPACPPATGDMNQDTFVNGDDIAFFVDGVFGSPPFALMCAGDFNSSLNLDVGDVDGFVAALIVP